MKRARKHSAISFGFFDKLKLNNEIISSTIIRSKLKNGDVKTSMEMLGQAYFISGKVTEGRRLGHTLGFPTLNLIPDNRKLMVKNGVYATRTFIEDGKKSIQWNDKCWREAYGRDSERKMGRNESFDLMAIYMERQSEQSSLNL